MAQAPDKDQKIKLLPDGLQETILAKSAPMPEDAREVVGYDFSKGIDYHQLLQSFRTSGFQATNFGMAVEEINRMVRLSIINFH